MPISFQSLGSFSATSLGGASRIASSASSPNLAERCDVRCETMPLATVISSGGTPQRAAAARTSIVRAAAPTLRICTHEPASELLPPVTM